MKLSDVLDRKGRNVVQTAASVSVRDAARTMCEHHVGCVALIDLEENLVGILTERDILRYFAADEEPRLDRPVAEVMSRNPQTVPPETSLDEALALMTERRFRRLPVVTDDGRLAGLVTMGDLVRATLDAKAEEAETLREYIAS